MRADDLGRPTRLDLFGRLITLALLGVTPFCLQRGYFRYVDESQWFFAQWVAPLAALIWFAGTLRRRAAPPMMGTVLVFAWAGWALASTLWADAPRFALHEASALAAGVFVYLLVLGNRLSTRRLVLLIFWLVVATAVFNAAVGGFQVLIQWGQTRETEMSLWFSKFLGYGRSILRGKQNVRAYFGHPNFLASFLTPAIALAGFLFWTRRDLRLGLLALIPTFALCTLTIILHRDLWSNPTYWAIPVVLAAVLLLMHTPPTLGRALFWLLGLIMIVGLINTRSRSGWIAFFVLLFTAAFAAWWHRRLRRTHVIALLLIVTVAAGGVAALRVHKMRTKSWEELATLQSATARAFDFGNAALMFRQAPVLGHGHGTFKVEYFESVARHQRSSPDAPLFVQHLREVNGSTPLHVHNDYLEIAVEAGLIGLLLFLSLLTWTAVRLGEVALTPPAAERTWLALALGAALLAILCDAMLSFPLNLPLSAMLFWCLLALAHRTVADAERSGDGRGRALLEEGAHPVDL